MTTMTLGECCEIVSGATPKTSVPEYWDGDVEWVTPADLSKLDGSFINETPRKITSQGLASCAARVLPVGSVLLSSRAPIGHVAINTQPMATNQGFKSLIPRPDLLEAKYLFHWLRANKNHLQSLGNGATFKEISKATLARVELPVPPLDEQRRIAAILDQADALRAKRRQALAHIDMLTQSIFQQMFAGRPHGSQPLAELAEIWDCPHSTPKWTSEGEVCLRTPNLTRGGWNWDDTRYVDGEQFATRSKGGGAQAGDIVLSREGTVGIAAIVEPGMLVCMGQRLVQVRVDQTRLDAEFALECLLTALHPDRIARVMVGSTARHLNVRDLHALPIQVTPMTEQAEFAAKVRAVRGQRSLLMDAGAADEEFFASLQSRAFRGEL